MTRGGFGIPYRPPCDGWPNPRKLYLGGLYQHFQSSLNGLPQFTNTTQVPLQPNQVGPPVTRIAPDHSGANSCEQYPDNGLPRMPWIGLADSQGLPPILGGTLNNTFTQEGTNNKARCRQRGEKWVQAKRQWHGILPWSSHDAHPCSSVFCANGSSYEPYQSTPTQTKYLTVGYDYHTSADYNHASSSGTVVYSDVMSLTGSRSVDALSGKLTSSLLSTELALSGAMPPITLTNVSGGSGDTMTNGATTHHASGVSTWIDSQAAVDYHCSNASFAGAGITPISLDDFVSQWNRTKAGDITTELYGWLPTDTSVMPAMPAVSSLASYDSGALAFSQTTSYGTTNWTARIQWTRTDTTYSWAAYFTSDPPQAAWDYSLPVHLSTSGTITLSSPNTSASVYSDLKNLMAYWRLNDDGQYPWRTDGVWQVAPLVSREEAGNTSPLGWNTATVDDLRLPITDPNGNAPWTSPQDPPPPYWIYAADNNDSNGRPPSDPDYSEPEAWLPTFQQMAWFDPSAYGFTFPDGRSAQNSQASAWRQYALTGKVLGMPMPQAFTDENSYWYIAGFSAPAGADFQNFFNFRAEVWSACQYDDPSGGTFIDFYEQGYGQWLYDAIAATGAQLPHCATQWTNNFQALSLPAYAYLRQADKQTYDLSGTPGPDSDFTAQNGDALWALKCAEVDELWPSYDCARPAGDDKFALDETAIYCSDGTVLTDRYGNGLTSLTLEGTWGGPCVNGWYDGAAVDAGGALRLGAKLFGVPSDWQSASGDNATVFGRLRWPDNTPSLLGRAAITVSGTRYTFAAAHTAFGLAAAGTEAVDVYDAGMALLASNVTATRVSDTMFTLPTNYPTAVWVTIHGAAAWYWDDTQRKGDFTAYQWLADYRTNSEAGRLAGVLDCSGAQVARPPANYGFQATSALAAAASAGNQLAWSADNFQAQGGIQFNPCTPMIIAITPNAETWPNAVVIPFPDAFSFDERYGAKWQCEIEQAMIDPLWQPPHQPCGTQGGDTWTMDDGNCHQDAPNDAGGDDMFYAHFTVFESRITLPPNGGPAQNETAPALPAPLTLGCISPVENSAGTLPPGQIGFDPSTGNPLPAWTAWGYRETIEDNACEGACRFSYQLDENLACVKSFAPAAQPTAPTLSGLPGLS
jgi:hypothetical protein